MCVKYSSMHVWGVDNLLRGASKALCVVYVYLSFPATVGMAGVRPSGGTASILEVQE